MSDRGITTALQQELQDSSIRPILLIKLDFDSGPLNLFDGIGQIDYLGDTYFGAGNLLSISALPESVDNKALGAKVSLSIDPAIVAASLLEQYQGRPAILYLGLLNEQFSIIPDPIKFEYLIDNMNISDDGQAATVTVNLEDEAIRNQLVQEYRYTDAEQTLTYPTDRAFLGTPKIANRSIYWGNVRP